MIYGDLYMDILNSLFGAFFGAMLAFISDLVIKSIIKSKKFKKDFKTLLLIMADNNNVIEKINKFLRNDSTDSVNKYNCLFSRYNYQYTVHPIYTYFTNVQSYLYSKYKKTIENNHGSNINLYYLVLDVVKMQSIIVDLQNNPVKAEDTSTKVKIVKRFNGFYEQYKEKYYKVIANDEIKKHLKK